MLFIKDIWNQYDATLKGHLSEAEAQKFLGTLVDQADLKPSLKAQSYQEWHNDLTQQMFMALDGDRSKTIDQEEMFVWLKN